MKNKILVLAQKMLAMGDYKMTTALLNAQRVFTFPCDCCNEPAIITIDGSYYCAKHKRLLGAR